MTKPDSTEGRSKSNAKADEKKTLSKDSLHSYAARETIESIVVAVLLAFLFRTFVGEAFVIPTGSMAPTLQGNHKDVTCSECGFPYQANASVENDDHVYRENVVATTCPLCRYTMEVDRTVDRNHMSFTGDRILVSKFSYDLMEPARWDVIVFKYPNNAKQNYIKRLIGLPGESLRVRHGDVFVKKSGESEYRIARKPPHKITAMLQVVHDTSYLSPQLSDAGWPSRWQPGLANGKDGWRKMADDGSMELTNGGAQESWFRYRHLIPAGEDWSELLDRRPPSVPEPGPTGGQLITDFYAYNAYTTDGAIDRNGTFLPVPSVLGNHWVGDLGLEADVHVQGNSGELILELVEGGDHYQCRIDVSTGLARMSVVDKRREFVDEAGQPITAVPQATTGVRGPGHYQIRFTNIDDELRLWVDNRLVEFDSPATYISPSDRRPHWSPEDLGDLAPAGIGTKGVAVKVDRLRVLRDVYYIAIRAYMRGDNEYDDYTDDATAQRIFADPRRWADTKLWDTRRHIDFELGPDQFFPMGDNSPQSKDGRLWGEPAYVERDLFTGKAVLVYWPHSWNGPMNVPIPNVSRMRLIR